VRDSSDSGVPPSGLKDTPDRSSRFRNRILRKNGRSVRPWGMAAWNGSALAGAPESRRPAENALTEISVTVPVNPCGVWPGALRCGIRIGHRGLRALHEQDNPARSPASSASRLKRILFRLQEATYPRSADAPDFRPHTLKGDRAGQCSVRVSGDWRVVFRFEDGEAVDLDLIDYH